MARKAFVLIQLLFDTDTVKMSAVTSSMSDLSQEMYDEDEELLIEDVDYEDDQKEDSEDDTMEVDLENGIPW